MNLILIVADTLRADHLGCYGSTRVRTPNLDALAARSTVFWAHHAASFPTMPARADFFLGKWMFTYRGWEPLPPGERTLATILNDSGFRTAGIVDTPFYMLDGFDYDHGFQLFADLDTQRRGRRQAPRRPQIIPRPRQTELDYAAPRTFHLAEQVLEQLYRDPFFLLVDTWDPHEPWDPPPWYVEPYRPGYDGRTVEPPYGKWAEAGLSEDDLALVQACYAGEITMVDRWVGRLLERLESLGVAEQTAIAFTSDHGYYFGEHGYLGKMVVADRSGGRVVWERSPLYREVTWVPLIVYVPGQPARQIQQLTSAVDLMPTLVEILTGKPPEGVHGRSLLPLVRGDSLEPRPYVVTSPPLTNPGQPIRVVDDRMRYVSAFLPATVTTQEWALLYSSVDDPVELYHLPSDPEQTSNVAAERRDVVAGLVDTYISFLESVDTPEEYLVPRRSKGAPVA